MRTQYVWNEGNAVQVIQFFARNGSLVHVYIAGPVKILEAHALKEHDVRFRNAGTMKPKAKP